MPINNELIIKTNEKLGIFLNSFSKLQLPVTAEHGDYSPINILIDQSGKIFVLDWEFYQENAEPLFDFVFFLLSTCTKKKPYSLRENFYGSGKYAHIIRVLISEFTQAKGLPVDIVVQAVPYVIVRRLYRASRGTDNKQLDITEYLKMLEDWDKACL